MATPQPYQIRKALTSDIPTLTDLIDLSVRTLHPATYSPAVITAALKSVYGVDTTLLADGHYFLITASSSPSTSSSAVAAPETVIACGGWSNRTTLYGGDQFSSRDPTRLDPSKDAAKIRAMFVHPDWTRKGVGRFLIEKCEEAAKAKGFARVEMGATLAGVAFYESVGYRSIETQWRDLGEGVQLEIRRMEKVFS